MEAYDLPKNEWPKYLKQHEEIKGIRIGDCRFNYLYSTDDHLKADMVGRYLVYPDGEASGYAHAHNKLCSRQSFQQDAGWICIPQLDYVHCKKMMMHELAHIKDAYGSGHTKLWGDHFLSLGEDLLGYYYKGYRHVSFSRNSDTTDPKSPEYYTYN